MKEFFFFFSFKYINLLIGLGEMVIVYGVALDGDALATGCVQF